MVTRNPRYGKRIDPTPEEIRSRAAEIRATWPERVWYERSKAAFYRWKVLEVDLRELAAAVSS